MMRAFARSKWVVWLFPLCLVACVSQPVYDWRSQIPNTFPKNQASMSDALKYLDYARTGYRSAITEHMKSETNVSRTMIIGSGVLLTAAGLKAPTDVLLAGGAATGTVYGLGSSELPRARVNAYLAGIDALNCAEASVAAIRVTDMDGLKSAVDELEEKSDLLRGAIAGLRNFVANAGAAVPGSDEVLRSAQQTLTGATTVVTGTREFIAKNNTAATELYTQVEKIDKAVTVAVASSTPDLSQVKLSANELGTSISGIVAKAVSNANASKTAIASPVAPQAGNQRGTDYSLAKAAVEQAQDVVNGLMRKVKALLPPNYDSLVTSTMTNCGVAPVPAPFVANPTELDFKVKKAKSYDVALSGGTKEYVVDKVDLPKGITVTPPGKDGSVLKVALDGAADAVAGTYELRLHDQTPAGNGVLITVVVAAADPAPAGAGAGGGKASAKGAGAAKGKDSSNGATAGAAKKETQVLLDMGGVKVGDQSYPVFSAVEQSDKSILVGLCGTYDDSKKAAVLAVLTEQVKGKVKAKLAIQRSAVCP